MEAEECTEHFFFFPVTVQSTRHPDPERINAALLPEIGRLCRETPDSRTPISASKAYSTVNTLNNLDENPIFKELNKFILDELNIYANEYSIKKNEYGIIIDKMWINIYEESSAMEVHNHPNSTFTGVYFVQAPEKSAPLILKSELFDRMLEQPTTMKNDFNAAIKEITPEPGLLVLFKSHIMHGTLLHKLAEERISISFTAMA